MMKINDDDDDDDDEMMTLNVRVENVQGRDGRNPKSRWRHRWGGGAAVVAR